jgi:hypothetical protein
VARFTTRDGCSLRYELHLAPAILDFIARSSFV